MYSRLTDAAPGGTEVELDGCTDGLDSGGGAEAASMEVGGKASKYSERAPSQP